MTPLRPLSYRALFLLEKKNKNLTLEEDYQAERCIVGYTTRDHLILDLDKSDSLFITEKLVRLMQANYPDIGDCLISESSLDGFHCIFDNRLSWRRIMHISRTLTSLFIVNRNFVKVRKFREDLTLRITSIDRGEEKSEAPIPKMLVSYPTWHKWTPEGCEPLESMMIHDIMQHLKQSRFSGILNYLECLSAFRDLDPLLVQVA
jgi:hypothetical protein